MRRPGRGPLVAGFAGIAAAVVLGGCGSFDSAASGAKLIKDFVARNGQGDVSVKTVKCPSGVKEVTGKTYRCNVTLHYQKEDQDTAGQVTIHMVAGDKVEIQGSRDFHF
jgi:hypothetical protein